MGAAEHAAGRAAVRRLAVSRAASASGGIAAYTALSYVVYARTGSAGWVAAAVVATFGVAGFVSPLAGLAADRLDRRRLMIVYAALIAAWGVGQVAAGAAFRRLPLGGTVRGDLGAFATAMAAVAACWLVSAALPVVAVVVAVQLVGGAGAASAFAIRQTLLQRRSPPALAGRVFAAADTLLDAGQLGGVVLAGIAADALGARGSYGLAGLLAVAGAAAVALGAVRPSAPAAFAE